MIMRMRIIFTQFLERYFYHKSIVEDVEGSSPDSTFHDYKLQFLLSFPRYKCNMFYKLRGNSRVMQFTEWLYVFLIQLKPPYLLNFRTLNNNSCSADGSVHHTIEKKPSVSNRMIPTYATLLSLSLRISLSFRLGLSHVIHAFTAYEFRNK